MDASAVYDWSVGVATVGSAVFLVHVLVKGWREYRAVLAWEADPKA